MITTTNRLILGVALATGVAACGGGLSSAIKRDITFKVQDRQPALTDCYSRALALNPTLQADMLVAFEVREETRRFRSVRVKEGAGVSPDLERCLIEELRDIQLDKAPDVKVEATLPVQFTPTGGVSTGVGDDMGDFDDDLK